MTRERLLAAAGEANAPIEVLPALVCEHGNCLRPKKWSLSMRLPARSSSGVGCFGLEIGKAMTDAAEIGKNTMRPVSPPD